MDTLLFEQYYNYKQKIVFKYSILLSKILGINKNKLWHKKKSIEDSLLWIIDDYFKSYTKNSNINTVRMFISDKDVFKYNINRELGSVINYFIATNRAFEIKAYEKEIVLAAAIVNIANNLDIATSVYKDNMDNYRTILNKYLEKFNKIPYFNLIDDSKKNTESLLDLIKENIKMERKIFESLNSKISFNKYINISSDDKYYLSQYNYSVPNIKSVDINASKYVYEKNNIDDKFVLLSKDHIIVTLMKLFSLRKLRKVFFLPIKVKFFENKENINELKKVYDDSVLSKYIKVLINYDEYSDDLDRLLKDNGIDYYLYCTKSSVLKDIRVNNYLLSRDFANINKDFSNELSINYNVIVEDFKGIEIDNDLIESEEEL